MAAPDDTDGEDLKALFARLKAEREAEGDDEVPTFRKPSKHPRRSARRRLRNRKLRLEFALLEVELAIDDIYDSPGKVHKRKELERLKQGIVRFREETGLRADPMEDFGTPDPDVDILGILEAAGKD
ncbi:hypothetical protein [Mesorhizobium sp. B2-4-11]|uniref:hypothetical protein n=1 Tax=Mesorhizobium sp. B2-4-11 TaxID=2589938 RepID=UPI00112B933E|nr:hypothetical protein [Mesorhizobium sp. B2-4-11]TPL04296.1 hypothetical protein FJ944_26655 [Mesorhizobium sp. B2-4-11]